MFGLHFSRLGSVNILAPINRALSFISALSNSITPQRGSAATFTRSTRATFVDQDSVVRTAKINEARFPGLRRVENLLTYSEDFSNAAWVSYGTVTRTSNSYAAPDGTLTADTLTIAASSGIYQQLAIAKTSNYLASIYVRGATAQIVDFIMNGDNSGVTSTTVTITPQWQRVTVSKLTNSLDTAVSVQLYNSSTGAAFEVWGAQLENVTGQSVQTVGEYVSTNVLSSPYHGAGVDGVKYLTTTLAGAPLSGKFLSEPARTNLMIYSEDLTNAAWGAAGGLVVTPNTTISPDGSSTADTATATSAQYLDCSATFTNGVAYTFSIYLKSGSLTSAMLLLYGTAFNSGGANVTGDFNLAAGTVALGNCTGGIVSVGNGWYRCWITATLTATTGLYAWQSLRLNSAGTVYAWGAQLEAGNRVSSYIPTVAATVTRAADSLTYPVTASPTQGGFSCTLIPAEAPAKAGTYPGVGLIGAAGHHLGVFIESAGSILYLATTVAGSVTGYLPLLTASAGTTYKVAVSWDSSRRLAASVNGAAVLSTTASSMPATLATLFQTLTGNIWNGQISDVKVFTQTLSDTTLRQLTT